MSAATLCLVMLDPQIPVCIVRLLHRHASAYDRFVLAGFVRDWVRLGEQREHAARCRDGCRVVTS